MLVLEAAAPSVRFPLGPVAARGPTWWPPPSGARRRTTASAGHSLPAAAECRADGGGGAQGRGRAPEPDPDPDARAEGRGRRLTPWAAAATALVRARPTGPVLYACATTTVGERGGERERRRQGERIRGADR